MIAAGEPVQRPHDAKLLVIAADGSFTHARRADFVDFLRPGDLVVANDAATLPASLHGHHLRTGAEIEVRLAGRRSLSPQDVHCFSAVVFGAGDFRTPTERRPPPPALEVGDRLELGPLVATVMKLLDHPRLVLLRFAGSADDIWAGIAHHGRPLQYAHVHSPLALWDVWTTIAGSAAAFESPSAGFLFDWRMLARLRERAIDFASITHAAGISSTGDESLDARLPFDEAYEISERSAAAIDRACREGRRVVAIGTTVVRALEDAARASGHVRAGAGLATHKITKTSRLRVVNAIVSGVHAPGTSHYELLGAFVDEGTLKRADAEMAARAYRTHEFGDSVFIDKPALRLSRPARGGSEAVVERIQVPV